MERCVHTNEDGSITLTEDEETVTFARDPEMDDAAWLARIDEACADFFTPLNADGEPLTGLALLWHRITPTWLKTSA